jgi:uncharacterized damage-inducible protein DinB
MTNRQFFLQHCSSELPKHLAVLEAVPANQLGYRPHPKSRSSEELIGHLIGHVQDLVELAKTGKINHRIQVPFQNLNEAIETYRKEHKAVEQAVGAMSDATWESPGQFLIDGKVVYEFPRRDLAWLLHCDSLHHRGQLSAYLRPMGGKVPAIYGPSADTMVAAT